MVQFLYIVLMKTRLNHNYEFENYQKPAVKERRKQRRSADTKGLNLLEDNARSLIHSDVINYLTEEGINIMAQPAARCTMRLLPKWLDEANEKFLARAGIEGGEKYSRRRIFERLFERMKLCINNHGDYFGHLIK